MSQSDQRPGPGWRRTSEALEILGIQPSTWEKLIRPKMPPDALQQGKGCCWVHCPSIVQRIREQERERAARAKSTEADGSIEAKRIVETRLAELKLQRELGQLVPVDEIAPIVLSFANKLSQFADSVARKSTVAGAEVQTRMNEIIDDCRQGLVEASAARQEAEVTE